MNVLTEFNKIMSNKQLTKSDRAMIENPKGLDYHGLPVNFFRCGVISNDSAVGSVSLMISITSRKIRGQAGYLAHHNINNNVPRYLDHVDMLKHWLAVHKRLRFSPAGVYKLELSCFDLEKFNRDDLKALKNNVKSMIACKQL